MALGEERAKVKKDLQGDSLPFRAGRGLREFGKSVGEFGESVVKPISSATMDALTLPSRAVGYGVGEAFKGLTGQPAGPAFDVRPLTSQAFEESRTPLVTPTMPDRTLAATGLRLSPDLDQQALPADTAAQEGMLAEGLPMRASAVSGTPLGDTDKWKGIRAREVAISNRVRAEEDARAKADKLERAAGPKFLQPFQYPDKFGADTKARAAANAAIEKYNKMQMDAFSTKWVDIPEARAKRDLMSAQETALFQGTGGLVPGDTQQEGARGMPGLEKINIDEATGEVNALGEPVMRKKQVLYDPSTDEVIDPSTRIPRGIRTPPAGAPATSVDTGSLRNAYEALPSRDRKIVEDHFSGREDVTSKEVMDYIKDLNK